MYTAHFPRLHPSDFRVKTLDGVADDWPIDYDTLAPFFAENDRMMGVSGLSGDPASRRHDPPMPPLPLGRSGVLHAKAMNKLGWHWWPSDTTVATVDYEGRARCINLGHCTPGCAQGAKASTDITYWPRRCAPASSCAPIAGCARSRPTSTAWLPASSITTRTASSSFSRRKSSSSPATASARRGCCSIPPPNRFPNGLANSSGLVGKNLMFHPYASGLRLCRRSRPTATARRRPACGARSSTRPTCRAASCAATRSSSAAASGRCSKPS